MKDYPITSKNVNMMIGFSGDDHDYPDPPSIALVMTANDKVNYARYDKIRRKFIDDYEESYYDALRIVREEELSGKNSGDQAESLKCISPG